MRSYAVVLLLMGSIFANSAGAVSDGLGAPRLTMGDFWAYRTNTTLGGSFYLAGEATISVAGEGPVTIEGLTTDAVVMTVTGTGSAAGTVSTRFGSVPASGRWQLTGEETLESAGLKVVESVLDLEANGTLRTQPVPVPFLLSVQNTTTFRFFADNWRFPIDVGTTTVVTAAMNFSEDSRLFYGFQTQTHAAGQSWWNVSYALEGIVAIDTMAGHFDTYRIRETGPDGSNVLFYYAPSVGNNVRTTTYNRTSEVATSDLVSYRYQALEPARFQGLTLAQWELASVVAAAACASVAGWVWIRRRTRSAAKSPPPSNRSP